MPLTDVLKCDWDIILWPRLWKLITATTCIIFDLLCKILLAITPKNMIDFDGEYRWLRGLHVHCKLYECTNVKTYAFDLASWPFIKISLPICDCFLISTQYVQNVLNAYILFVIIFKNTQYDMDPWIKFYFCH